MDLDDLNLENLKDQAADLLDEHGDKIKDGIDKAAGVADDKTGGQHTERIGSVADKAKDVVDRLAGGKPDPA
jgi:ABC-type transporter Mla subunit MlaD